MYQNRILQKMLSSFPSRSTLVSSIYHPNQLSFWKYNPVCITSRMKSTSLNSNINARLRTLSFDRSSFLGKNQTYHTSVYSRKNIDSGPANSSSIFQNILASYNKVLDLYPMITKAITSGLIMGCGDIICQVITNDDDEDDKRKDNDPQLMKNQVGIDIDWKRTLKFSFLGGVFVGPACHYWYGYLMRIFPANTNFAAFQRTVIDQLCFAPLFIATFFTALQILDDNDNPDDSRTSFEKIKNKLEQDFWSTMQSNWALWFPAQLVNFRFVPGAYQVLFSNGISFIWNIYLSFVSFR